MADSFIEVAPDSTGKKLQTFENTISANDVHAEAVVLVDQFGVPLGVGTNTGILQTLLFAEPSNAPGAAQILNLDSSTGALLTNIVNSVEIGGFVAEDAPALDGAAGIPAMAIRKATPANTSDTDGDYEMLQMDGGKLWVKGDFSLPTGAATEAKQDTQITDLGGVTETAPATDTASSGLNGRLQRIAQRITSFIALFPTSIGQKTKATALGVTLASDEDDFTVQLSAAATSQLDDIILEIGATTATAPASDTATASLNGRLQRISQRITSLIALLPASLGQKTKANSFAVTLASDSDTLPVSAASLPLPTGAATEATLATRAAAATQTDGTQRTKITDGTTNAAVKAASTAAIATDPALVVAISPNNPIAVTVGEIEIKNDTGNPVPISAASLPLPTGAATEAGHLATIDTSTAATAAVVGTTAGAAIFTNINGTIQQYLRGLVSLWAAGPPLTDNQIRATPIPVSLASGATAIAKAEDVASANADVGVPAMAIQKATPADLAGTDGDYAMLQMSGGSLWTRSADGNNATEGITTGAAVITDATGTLQQYLRGLVKLWAAGPPLTDTQLRASAVPVSAASLPLPAGASTAAKQPALGTALAPSTDVLTTQRPAITQVVSTAFEASKVLKSSAGQLVQLSVFNSGPAQFILLMNSTTLPANGAVTLLYPPIPIAAATLLVLDLPAPLVASTGIVVCNSSTGSFTKTIGAANCAFYAQVN